MNYELILFDLDGTLLDTSQGIFNSVRYAESQMGLFPIPESQLRLFVGPPPKTMYLKLYGLTEEEAIRATTFHREYGRREAIYEAIVYPGVKETLTSLRTMGLKTAVATLKKQEIAESILEHFGLQNMFDTIVGMDEKESMTKAQTIQKAIYDTSTEGKVLMVGDSQYDLDGARKAEVDFVGALYGFGFKKDDLINGFTFIHSFDELLTVLIEGNI